MTNLIYTNFILSKMSLQERLIFELFFGEMALLVLRLDFFFQPPTVFELILLQHLLQMFQVFFVR